jgi:hypothetical protein
MGGAAFNPLQLSSTGAWFTTATNAGSGLAFNWLDVVNSINATTSTDARKPTINVAANGVQILTFAGDDCLLCPIVANNSATAVWGCGFHMRPHQTTVADGLLNYSTSTGGNVNRFQVLANFTANANLVAYQNGQSAPAPAVLTNNVWKHVSVEFVGANALGSRTKVFIDGVASQASDDISNALAAITGTFGIGADVSDGSFGYNGDLANLVIYKSAMADAGGAILTTGARAALGAFQLPT